MPSCAARFGLACGSPPVSKGNLLVYLPKRTTHRRPDWCKVGARIHALAPTVHRPLTGVVHAVDGFTVTLAEVTGMFVAVDVEDCIAASSRRPDVR